MPCGKRPLIRDWDKSRHIRTVKPSRYQQNEASVKVHWKKVVKDLELNYKDDKFWDTQCDAVRELVGPSIFERIAKIFGLPLEATQYQPKSEVSSVQSSSQFYTTRQAGAVSGAALRPTFSMSDYEPSVEEEQVEEESEMWSDVTSFADTVDEQLSKSRSKVSQKQSSLSKSFSKSLSKSISKGKSVQSGMLVKGYSSKIASKSKTTASEMSSPDSTAATNDDLDVHARSITERKKSHKRTHNPHFDLLYCNESETDMITWDSKYKQKTFEISASDEFSKKAELLTKQIAFEFFEWWTALGNVEFKSEIKRPEDIEELFQVWFDEHASRGLKLDPRILPCVLQSIADYVGESETACPKVLKRQIAYDIHAETSPAHTMAFGSCLPLKLKHVPPKNNTKEMWHCVKIPEDLRSFAAVWEEIQHLTSVKAFHYYLTQRQQLPMPPIFKAMEEAAEKKQLFVVPSDFVVRTKSMDDFSTQNLAIPVSQFSLELKEVLSRLLND